MNEVINAQRLTKLKVRELVYERACKFGEQGLKNIGFQVMAKYKQGKGIAVDGGYILSAKEAYGYCILGNLLNEQERLSCFKEYGQRETAKIGMRALKKLNLIN